MKQKILPNISDKAAAYHPHKQKTKEIFLFQAFHASFGNEPSYYLCSYTDFHWMTKALTFQQIAVIDKKLHLMTICLPLLVRLLKESSAKRTNLSSKTRKWRILTWQCIQAV